VNLLFNMGKSPELTALTNFVGVYGGFGIKFNCLQLAIGIWEGILNRI
jgi:hypothetical protein